MLERHMLAQIASDKIAPAGVKIAIKFNGVQTTTLVVFIASSVITSMTMAIITSLLQDMYHFVPAFVTRRLKFMDKTLSTSTLRYQVVGLVLSIVFLIIPLSFLTVFVFTKDARAVVTQNGVPLECPATGTLNLFCTPIIYSKTEYIRINAELPWATVLLGIISTVVTFMAWRKRPVAAIHNMSTRFPIHTNMITLNTGLQNVEVKAVQIV